VDEDLSDWLKNPWCRPAGCTRGSHHFAWWKCSACTHQCRTEIRFRTRSVHPTDCPKCARIRPRRKLSSSNNFETRCRKNGDKGGRLLREYDDHAKQAHAVTYGSEHKAWWKCETCKSRWQAPVKDRTRAGRPSRCPLCGVGR